MNEPKAAAVLYLHQYIMLHCEADALRHEGRVCEEVVSRNIPVLPPL